MVGKEYSTSYHCFPPFKSGFEELDRVQNHKDTESLHKSDN